MAYYKLNIDGTFQSANKQLDSSWLPLSNLEVDVNNNYYKYYNQDGTPDLIKEREEFEALALIEAKKVRADKMLEGATYTLNGVEYQISFTKEDGDGLVQVKSAFELGLTQTIIHFSNGTELPISTSGFAEFASWFVNKRNEFF